MRFQGKFRRVLLANAQIAAVACISAVLLLPANAQFWGNWGSQPQRPAPQQRQPQGYNPFGGFLGGSGSQQREAPVDYSHAPAPQRKSDVPASTTVLVL